MQSLFRPTGALSRSSYILTDLKNRRFSIRLCFYLSNISYVFFDRTHARRTPWPYCFNIVYWWQNFGNRQRGCFPYLMDFRIVIDILSNVFRKTFIASNIHFRCHLKGLFLVFTCGL